MKYLFFLVLISIVTTSYSQRKNFFSNDNNPLDASDSLKSYYYTIEPKRSKKEKSIPYDKPTIAFYTKTNTVYYNEVRNTDNNTLLSRTYYYSSGKLKSTVNFLLGNPNGTITSHYEDGSVKSELIFETPDPKSEKEQIVGIVQYIDPVGKVLVEKGNGMCHCYLNPLVPDLYLEDGIVKNGFKVGQWTGKSNSNSDTFKEVYKDGALIVGILLSDSIQYKYQKISVPPTFPGGTQNLMQFISTTMKYPDGARRGGVQGKVYISFEVDVDGSVINPKTLQGVDKVLDEEALRVVSLLPKWNPGYKRGKAVKARFILPLNFKLG